MTRACRSVAAALLCVLALGAGVARADGDPASDYLLARQVFAPYDVHAPSRLKAQLAGVVREANRSGYRIRVAVIASSYDLGSVTSLWRRPRAYARFLGIELSFVYKGRLLVAMPNGFGYRDGKRSPAAGYRTLARLRVGSGGTGLTRSAIAAVERLAAAGGVTVRPPAVEVARRPSSGGGGDRLHVAIGVAVLVALYLLWRRLAPRRRRG
jgi:hypothetical protein